MGSDFDRRNIRLWIHSRRSWSGTHVAGCPVWVGSPCLLRHTQQSFLSPLPDGMQCFPRILLLVANEDESIARRAFQPQCYLFFLGFLYRICWELIGMEYSSDFAPESSPLRHLRPKPDARNEFTSQETIEPSQSET